MTSRNYPWTRYWCPRTASFDLSVDGYLTDPESDYGGIANRALLRFSQIAQTPCLVLLGEPGIGKTRTIRAEFDQGRQAGVDDIFDFVDLRAYGDERRLVDRLFDTESVRRWMAGTNRLHLLLDSLDECLLRIDTVAALLPEELRKLPLDRLSLRLTCRTAVWPALLEAELKRLWPQEDSLGIYELAPLRRADAEIAAQTNGIRAEDFCRAIDGVGAVPLAIKPVTLEMLLREYSTAGELTSDRWTLYERGCLQMAAELNESRLASGRKGKLTGEQRLAVAGRVAAVTTIANRYAVWTSPDLANQPLEDVQLQELVGGTETAHGDQLSVRQEELEEALDTGLFTGRGGGRLGWAHQTYAEFLAARHLVEHDLNLPQILGLIRHPDGKLIPQLHELAAWVATKRTDLFDEVVASDPEVMIRSDVAASDEVTRASVTGALLAALDTERLHDMAHDLIRHYPKLKHGGLAQQLRPYICDPHKGLVVRRSAILIARECRDIRVSADLLQIALDEKEDEHIRSVAILALGQCGNEETKAALKPLVLNSIPTDTSDEIRGCALTLLWPRHLSAAELFTVLTPSRQPHVLGTYCSFISTGVSRHLQTADLELALDWILKLEAGPSPMAFSRDFEMAALADEIVLSSLAHLDDPPVAGALARVVMQRLRSYYRAAFPDHGRRFDSIIGQDRTLRHRLVEALVPEMNADRRDAILIAPILVPQDLVWLVEQTLKFEPTDDSRAAKFAFLAGECRFDLEDRSAFETVYQAAQQSPLIFQRFEWLLKPVELDSQVASDCRAYYRAGKSSEPEAPAIDPPPMQRVLEYLDQQEAGDVNAWWQLNYWMLFDSQRQVIGELQAELTDTPGWKAADEATRTRLIRGAENYIRTGQPDTQRWFGTDNLHRPAFAGYRAFQLLRKMNPMALAAVEPTHWNRWAAIIVTYPGNSDEATVQQEIIAEAYLTFRKKLSRSSDQS